MIAPNTPSNGGGAVVSYAISPALPTGLSLNTTTGVISGTPTDVMAATVYTVTATNTGGSTTVTLSIVVNALAPSITVQPADQTVSTGATATFSAVASGTSPLSYQWRKDGVTISGATAASYNTPVTTTVDTGSIYSVVVSNSVGTATSRNAILTVSALAPVAFTYVDFNGVTLNLFAWEGSKTVLLSRNSTLSVATMAAILDATDKSYAYYNTTTGYTPGNAKLYNGKPTIADVPSTCGAGCGNLGATGIELQNTYFDLLYNQVNINNLFDQPVFYEFGRNFWSLGSRIEYIGADSTGAITTGFAVFMRFMAMDASGVQGAPFGAWSFSEFRARVEAMVDLYQVDSTQTWANTLKLGHAQTNNPSGLGATDLFASVCFRLRRDYGGNAFIDKLWKESAKRPVAVTTQDAVDNFFLAACAAANKNLTTLFETTWRWPLSTTAKTAAMVYPN